MRERQATILIADDDPEILNLLIEVLQPDGYRLLVARDSQEAVPLALAHSPDLLLLDVVMPGGGGYEIGEQLREQAPERDWRVILVTALDDPAQIRQGFAAGILDYITKPFSVGQLRTRVRCWLLRGEQEASRHADARALALAGRG
jgi:DNA-binding response OmpR family regulator